MNGITDPSTMTVIRAMAFRLILLCCLLLADLNLGGVENQSLLTPEEISLLNRESEMWRAVRTDKDIPQNIELLRKRGFSDSDIAWFQPKMESVWRLPGDKSLGILNSDTREKIEEVERSFVSLYRDIKRFEEVGIRPTSGHLYSREELNQMWLKAMAKALSFEEERDYGLARSSEADRVERVTQGITITSSERKELIKMAQDFGDVDGAIPTPRPTWLAYYEATLEYYSAIQELLGGERFPLYLRQANEEYRTIIFALGDNSPSRASLDLFWLKLKTEIALREKPITNTERNKICAEARQELDKLLDPHTLEIYLHSDHAKWLGPL